MPQYIVGWGFGPPERCAEEAAWYVAEGFRTIKIKIGRPRTDLDQRMIATVRRRLGDRVELKVDANTDYSSPMQAIRCMEGVPPAVVEQPLKADQPEGMAFVRAHISTTVLADESMWRWQEAYAVARASAADVLSVYVSEAGGLAAAKAFATGEAAGLPALIGGRCELGIRTAAMAHLAVAMPISPVRATSPATCAAHSTSSASGWTTLAARSARPTSPSWA